MRPPLKPRQALNPAFLKIKPQRQDIGNIPIKRKKLQNKDPNTYTSMLEAEMDRMVY